MATSAPPNVTPGSSVIGVPPVGQPTAASSSAAATTSTSTTVVELTDGRVKEFVTKVENIRKHSEQMFADLGSVLHADAAAGRRNTRLADHLKQYSVRETPQLRSSISKLSSAIRQVEDHRRSLDDYLLGRVMTNLSVYDNSKAQQWRGYKSERERSTQRLAELDRKNPTGAGIAAASTEAKEDKRRADNEFIKRMSAFESSKITDMKSAWASYAHAHMIFHAKALEEMAAAHAAFLEIDDASELAESMKGVIEDPRLKNRTAPGYRPTPSTLPVATKEEEEEEYESGAEESEHSSEDNDSE
ncbi:protein FAM92 [Pelomyxa schiedti]|nr:protein FAM92 [Pelomyxa schiedti]